MRVRTSSMTPRTPTSGVGRMDSSPVRLCKETLPPVTGTPSSRQPSTRPRMVSSNCHMMSGSYGDP